MDYHINKEIEKEKNNDSEISNDTLIQHLNHEERKIPKKMETDNTIQIKKEGEIMCGLTFIYIKKNSRKMITTKNN